MTFKEPSLTASLIEDVLSELANLARDEGKVIDLAIYGGGALCLVSNFRIATRDLDAVADDDGQRVIERLAKVVAERRRWSPDWLNDDVFPFLSDSVTGLNDHHSFVRSYPCEHAPGLRVFVPTAEYILAMKLMAMRIDDGSARKDRGDIVNLMSIVGISTKDDALSFLMTFYPEARVSAKVALGLDELFTSGDVPKEASSEDVAPKYLGRSGPSYR